jgi:hypothetical protein
MTTITELSETLQRLLTTTAEKVAKKQGLSSGSERSQAQALPKRWY